MSNNTQPATMDNSIFDLSLELENIDINNIFGSDIKNTPKDNQKITSNKNIISTEIENKKFNVDKLTEEEAMEHIKNKDVLDCSNFSIIKEDYLLNKIEEIYGITQKDFLKNQIAKNRVIECLEPEEIFVNLTGNQKWRFKMDDAIYKQKYIDIANSNKLDNLKKLRFTEKYLMLNVDPKEKRILHDSEYFTNEVISFVLKKYDRLEDTKKAITILYDTNEYNENFFEVDVKKTDYYFQKNIREKIVKFIDDNINGDTYYSEFVKSIFNMDEQQNLKDYKMSIFKLFYEDIRTKNKILKETTIQKLLNECVTQDIIDLYKIKSIRLNNIALFKNHKYNLNLKEKYIEKEKIKNNFCKYFDIEEDEDILESTYKEKERGGYEMLFRKKGSTTNNNNKNVDQNSEDNQKVKSKSKDKSKNKNKAKTKKCFFDKINENKNEFNFNFKEINFDNGMINLKDNSRTQNMVNIKTTFKKEDKKDEQNNNNK